jgi:hypothetical protein
MGRDDVEAPAVGADDADGAVAIGEAVPEVDRDAEAEQVAVRRPANSAADARDRRRPVPSARPTQIPPPSSS